MTKPRAVVLHETDRPIEGWDEPGRGTVSWRTLFSADRSPTDSLTCGVAELPPGAVESAGLHRHTPAEIYYVLCGTGCLTIDGVDYPVTEGSAAFIPGDAEHALVNTGAETLRLFYAFAVDSFDEVEYRFSR